VLAVISFLSFASPAFTIISGGVVAYVPEELLTPDSFLSVSVEFVVLSALIAGSAISGVRKGLADPSGFSGFELYGEKVGLRGGGRRSLLGRIPPADVRSATLFRFGQDRGTGVPRYAYLKVRGRRSREATFHGVTAEAWDAVRRQIDDPRIPPWQRAHDVTRLLESRRLEAVRAWLEKNGVQVAVKNTFPDESA